MVVMVKRGDVVFPCKSEEQLNLFLKAGYVKVEPAKVEEPKEEPKAEPKEKKKKIIKK